MSVSPVQRSPEKKFTNQNSPFKDRKVLTSSISEEEPEYEKIITSLTSNYNSIYHSENGNNSNGHNGTALPLTKTIEHLLENIKPGICLICIEDVTRTDPIWSCRNCYCSLHLVCIQRWAKDSVANVREAAAYKGYNLPLIWCCPKCREEYQESEFPQKYTCFCGKVVDPSSDPWNAPHSCGETCGKPLKPECGHTCVLLCHAGACPPCPKQVNCSCFCGKSSPKTLRCFVKSWSCSQPCGKLLRCEFHRCPETCHDSECPPCAVPVTISCKCRNPKPITISCSELVAKTASSISCGEMCEKLLNCGIHTCQNTCHDGSCNGCKQSCPCGKRQVDCVGISGVNGPLEKCCEDTCEKLLDCGQHHCSQKCHQGSCGTCLQWVTKTCKCGSVQKEISCSKELTCTNKCRRMRDCGVHQCNKKCCEGDCPPCRNVCGKTLNCKNHKCESICHRGPCYPCPVSAAVKCRCGQTIRQVPCGSERKCKPPSCLEQCQLKTKCDHPQIQKHKCHFGDCPRCLLECGKILNCGHKCPALCHSFKLNKKDCPPCKQLVPSECPLHRGNNVMVECSKKSNPCEEVCAKMLACGFHSCMKRCHERLGTGCGECNNSCSQPRPFGCEHECPLGCHSGECPACCLVAKINCHCESETLFILCSKQNHLTQSEMSCKNQCPKKLSCGHRCLSICHSEPCLETERCRRKVKLTCKCKHFKKEIECFLVDKENKVLDCTEPFCPAVPKASPKGEGTSSSSKRRAKKKRTTSEGEKLDNNAATVDGSNYQVPEQKGHQGILGYSPFTIAAALGTAAVAFGIVLYRLLN